MSNFVVMHIEKINDQGSSFFKGYCQLRSEDFLEFPSICIVHSQTELSRYKLKSKYSKKSLQNFIVKYLKGKLKPLLQVQEITDRFEGGIEVRLDNIKNLNSETLHQVLSSRKGEYKLIYFYEKIDDLNMPIVKRLAEYFSLEPVTVARINANLNEIPDIVGLPVPFLAILTGIDQEYHLYEGDWEFDDLLRFVDRFLKYVVL